MKATDMLNALLEHMPDEGKIITRGRRALLLDLAPFEALRTELIDLARLLDSDRVPGRLF